MQAKIFSISLSRARVSRAASGAKLGKVVPVELSNADLLNVAGGRGPAGTWSALVAVSGVTSGPAGTW